MGCITPPSFDPPPSRPQPGWGDVWVEGLCSLHDSCFGHFSPGTCLRTASGAFLRTSGRGCGRTFCHKDGHLIAQTACGVCPPTAARPFHALVMFHPCLCVLEAPQRPLLGAKLLVFVRSSPGTGFLVHSSTPRVALAHSNTTCACWPGFFSDVRGHMTKGS